MDANANDLQISQKRSKAVANEPADGTELGVESLAPPKLFADPSPVPETLQLKEEIESPTEEKAEPIYASPEPKVADASPVDLAPVVPVAKPLQLKEEGQEETEVQEVQLKSFADAPSELPNDDEAGSSGGDPPANPSKNTKNFTSSSSETAQKQEGDPSTSSGNSNAGISNDVMGKMETTIGHDFSNVNIHTDSSKASEVGALAYTQGTDIHFAPGQFNPGSKSGQELLGHELTHVKQQAEGRVKPTTTASNGMAVNDDRSLEKEADNFGAKAANSRGLIQKKENQNQNSYSYSTSTVIQKYEENERVPFNEGGTWNGQEIINNLGQHSSGGFDSQESSCAEAATLAAYILEGPGATATYLEVLIARMESEGSPTELQAEQPEILRGVVTAIRRGGDNSNPLFYFDLNQAIECIYDFFVQRTYRNSPTTGTSGGQIQDITGDNLEGNSLEFNEENTSDQVAGSSYIELEDVIARAIGLSNGQRMMVFIKTIQFSSAVRTRPTDLTTIRRSTVRNANAGGHYVLVYKTDSGEISLYDSEREIANNDFWNFMDEITSSLRNATDPDAEPTAPSDTPSARHIRNSQHVYTPQSAVEERLSRWRDGRYSGTSNAYGYFLINGIFNRTEESSESSSPAQGKFENETNKDFSIPIDSLSQPTPIQKKENAEEGVENSTSNQSPSSDIVPVQMTPGQNNSVAGVENQVQTGASDNYVAPMQEIEGDRAEQLASNYINGISSLETAQNENRQLLAASEGIQRSMMTRYHVFLHGLPSQGIFLIQSDYDGLVLLMQQKIQELAALNQISPDDYQTGLNLSPQQEYDQRVQMSLSEAGIQRGFDRIYGRMMSSARNKSYISYETYTGLGSNANAASALFEELTHSIYDDGRDRLIEAAVGESVPGFLAFTPLLQGMQMLHEESQWNQRDDTARRAYRTNCIFNYLVIQYAQTIASHDRSRNPGQVRAMLNDQVRRYENWVREEEPAINEWARENLPEENQVDRIGPAQQKSKRGNKSINSRETSIDNGVNIIQKMESAFGTSFSDVKIHENSQSAEDNGALAYVQGTDIHFAPGQFKPDTKSGQELIGHELTHVVQQREGRVKQNGITPNGMPVNDDKQLEAEADQLGAKAASTGVPIQKKMEENSDRSAEVTSQSNKINEPFARRDTISSLKSDSLLDQIEPPSVNSNQAIQKKDVAQLKKPKKDKSKLPNKAPDVSTLLSQGFKNLKLGEGQIKQLQDCLDARLELEKLEEQLDEIKGSYLSSDARKRERIYKRARKYTPKNIKAIVVSTDKVLSKDFRGGKDELKDIKAFKEALYLKYISEPTYFVLGKGYNPSSIFTSVEWSQYRWRMGHDHGQITFEHGVQPQKFNLAYQKVLLSGSIDALEKMIEIRKAMGGMDPMAEGKKVGETYGHVWNSTIKVRSKIGNSQGYTPDEEGKLELNNHYESLQGARAVIVGSDKWSHIYSLESFTVKDLKGETGDEYGYLLTKGAEVSVQRIRTKDGFELDYGTGKTGTGWRHKQLLSELEQFSIGAIIGDFSEDPTATETVGQIAMGAVPIAGQIADARDTAAAISKLWTSGGKDGKLQLTFAIIGWVPLIGDGVKAAWKSGGKKVATKFVVESVQKNVDMLTKRLGKEIASNPGEWARKFGLDEAASSKMGKAIDDALETGSQKAINKLGKELIETYNKHGKSPYALINKAGGRWKNAVKILEKADGGLAIAQDLEVYRIAQFDAMVGHVGKTSKKYGPDVSLGGKPKFERTGTPSFKSDFDGSFIGPNASFFKERADEYMSAKFGKNWREVFDADIFTDPSRLHLYADATKNLSGGAAAAVEKRIVKDAELNVLAKMLNSGVAPEVVKKKADDLGVDLAQLTARQAELKDVSASYLAGLLNKGHPEDAVKKQAIEMGVDFKKVIEKQKSNSNAFRDLELKLDSLHGRYLSEKNPAKRAAIAEEMAKVQGKINASIPGPYMTPGGVLKHTTQRDKALRSLLTGAEFTPSMGYMQVMDDYFMLVTALPANNVFTEKSAKSFSKYADRLMITAGRFGAVDAGAASVRSQFDEIYAILQRARKEGTKSDLSKVQGIIQSNATKLQQQINNIETALKKTSDKYISELADRSKLRAEKGFIAKTISYLNKSKGSIAGMASLQLTKNYFDKKGSQKDIDKENEKVGQKKDAASNSSIAHSINVTTEKNMVQFSIPNNVNIHKNSSQATEMGALAFAQGSNIHFAPGQFKPNTRAGQELIGHELAHVRQQKEGRVKATSKAHNGIPVNDDRTLEKEADDFGRAFAAGNTLQTKSSTLKDNIDSSTLSKSTIQKHGDESEDEEKTFVEGIVGTVKETKDLSDFAETNEIPMEDVTNAIKNGSVGSLTDNLKTATAFLVAKAAGHPAANYILNGQVKVDALTEGEMIDKTGVAADGFYANMNSSDGKIIADTLYLRNHIVISELSSRGLIIHELTHANDDANAPLLEGEDSTTIPQFDFEANGYRSQARYLMDQIHNASAEASQSYIDEIVQIINGRDGMVFVYSFYLEAQINKEKYSPIIIKLLADPFPTVSRESVLSNLELEPFKIEMELYNALAAHPMYQDIDTKNIRVDGLKEHVAQPKFDSESKINTSDEKAHNLVSIPDSVKIHSDSSKATEMGALAFAQGSDIHFAPGQFKPDTVGGQELIGHELAHVQQQKEGRVKATTSVNGTPINDDKRLEKEADDFGISFANSLRNNSQSEVRNQSPRQFKLADKSAPNKINLHNSMDPFNAASKQYASIENTHEDVADFSKENALQLKSIKKENAQEKAFKL